MERRRRQGRRRAEPWPSITTRKPVVLNDSQFDDWMRGTLDQAAALMSGG
jgi:putative SOS response-associated peptidase YedK